MPVNLTPDLEARIERLRGDRRSAAAVIAEALDVYEELRAAIAEGVRSGPASPLDVDEIVADIARLLAERETLNRLRAEIAVGLADADRGDTEDGAVVLARLREKYASMLG
ncbi:MAG: hypothetical protein AB7N54_11595 [Alphaproteobacteria bacterium]